MRKFNSPYEVWNWANTVARIVSSQIGIRNPTVCHVGVSHTEPSFYTVTWMLKLDGKSASIHIIVGYINASSVIKDVRLYPRRKGGRSKTVNSWNTQVVANNLVKQFETAIKRETP